LASIGTFPAETANIKMEEGEFYAIQIFATTGKELGKNILGATLLKIQKYLMLK